MVCFRGKYNYYPEDYSDKKDLKILIYSIQKALLKK